jgi:hypothetical protein
MTDQPSSPTPAFLLSLPRSGSTLLQRMLATHSQIATGPEPTFLLPLFHMNAASEVTAVYDQRFTAMAIDDFFATTPDGTFDLMVREAALAVYSSACGHQSVRYFLDKTPKYHLIVDELVRTFPEAPMIVLWRNPLAVIASLMSTWGGGRGRWNLQHFRVDLFVGLPRLIDAVERHPERFVTLRYEDLVQSPLTETTRIFESLDLDSSDADVESFDRVHLEGRVQDPNSRRSEFRSVRVDRREEWPAVLGNPIRRLWCDRYLRWLGDARLAVMGYDGQDLRDQLRTSRGTRHLATDMFLLPYDALYRTFELRLMSQKLGFIRSRGQPMLAHK